MANEKSPKSKKSAKSSLDSRLARRREKPKSYERYDHQHPLQLSLFEILEVENRQYSNTVEIYDFLPKEFLGKATRVADTYLPRLEREFECRGIKYKMKLDPARVEDKDGTVREFYPSQREEVVEDCLRKLMVEGRGIFLDDQASVRFTLYLMGYRSAVARKLHMRLSHFYIQASLTDKCSALLSTLIRDFGLTKYSQMSKNLRDFEKAVEELKDSNTVLNFSKEEIKQERPRLKVIDYRLTIQPHPEFVSDVKKANYVKSLNESKFKTFSGVRIRFEED